MQKSSTTLYSEFLTSFIMKAETAEEAFMLTHFWAWLKEQRGRTRALGHVGGAPNIQRLEYITVKNNTLTLGIIIGDNPKIWHQSLKRSDFYKYFIHRNKNPEIKGANIDITKI